jgi:gas vesicle protein
MEHKEHHKGGGLSTGFLLGVVVGVIITLLLTTKRGKKILKMITDEGISKISNLEDMVGDMIDEYETKPVEPKLPSVELAEEMEVEDEALAMPSEKEEVKEVIKKESKPPVKRFFKGIHRPSVN